LIDNSNTRTEQPQQLLQFVQKIHSWNLADNGPPVLIGLETEAAPLATCAIGHMRTGNYDQGDIVFLNNASTDTAEFEQTVM
jgi:hypothetical protein